MLQSRRADFALPLALLFFCLFIYFYGLGSTALFEPTEGRNAEIAREILIIRNWMTPHDNFIPVLDKPIFFHWLIAICYQLFGVSEGAARLPAALAGLATIALTYLFARKFLGLWEALWSGLVLASSLQFFALSRIVLFDMPLTLFITLSLCSFYFAANCQPGIRKRLLYLLMYAAMGVATLTKGPIGIFIPGMVIVFYMLAAKRFLLREMEIIYGAAIFLIVAGPWYAAAELTNPGYLKYYLWEEHFARFFPSHFGRGGPAYYFVIVLAAGFVPWTFYCRPLSGSNRKQT